MWRSRHGRALLVLVLALSFLPDVVAPEPAAAECCNGWFKFDKSTNDNSTLYWRYTCGTSWCHYGWRAGSGTTTNACEVGKGWLPDGWYDLNSLVHNKDGVIKGRAWHFQDKQCSSGTWRTELFIHTEETKLNGQSCPTSGDDPYCWEGTFDYKSEGCIKVSYPNNGFGDTVGSAHSAYHDTSKSGFSDHTGHGNILQVVP